MNVSGKFSFVLSALALAALLAGCTAATTQPLPATPLSDAERARFDGVWMAETAQGVASVRIDCDGVGHLAWTEWRDGRFQMQELQFTFAQGKKGWDKARFVSLRVQSKDGKETRYLLVRYLDSGDNMLLVWAAQPAPFAEAIRSGRLQGQAGEHDNLITSPPEAVLDFIDDPNDVRLFNYQRPIVLRRLVAEGSDRPRPECRKK